MKDMKEEQVLSVFKYNFLFKLFLHYKPYGVCPSLYDCLYGEEK